DHASPGVRVECPVSHDSCGELTGHSFPHVFTRTEELCEPAFTFPIVEADESGRVQPLIEDRAGNAKPDCVLDIDTAKTSRVDGLCKCFDSQFFQTGECVTNSQPPGKQDERVAGGVRVPLLLHLSQSLGP